MNSLATNWSPSSCQLQLAFRYRKPPAALFVRSRMFSSGYRRLRVLCVAGDEAGESSQPQERRRSGDSWTSSGSAADGYSDWSGSGQSDSGKSTEGVGGIVGAGLAGVFLVAGLSFAALAISRKTTSRGVQEMEPLTKQQEVLLTSDEEVLCKEENVEDGKDIADDDLESKRDPENYSPSSPKSTIDVLESSPGDNDVSTSSANDKYALNGYGVPVEENLQSDSDAHYESTLQFPEAQNADGSSGVPSNIDSLNIVVLGTPEQVSEQIDLISMSLSSSDDKQGTLESSVGNYSSHEVELSSNYSDGYEYGDSEPKMASEGEHVDASLSTKDLSEPSKVPEISAKENHSSIENINSEWVSVNRESEFTQSLVDTLEATHQVNVNIRESVSESHSSVNPVVSTGIPAPSVLPATLLTPPGKVLIPAAVDQAHEQALAALQVLKVIEVDAQPSDLCTRREYARWLVSASSALSRNSISKVYPAMYIENNTELAFDDITPDDPDFSSIQGLAEAGLISSKLSQQDMLSSPDTDIGPFYFFPDSPLCRQDLVTWKMALEKRQFSDTNRKMLQQVSGFIDIDRIDPNAWPAVLADISAGEHGIIAHAFGYTRLFQPDKPVTKAQAAIALGTGETADIVSEELARIEAESVAENAVAAHSALVSEVEKDVNASFEKELLIEREKIEAVEKMAEEARQELERLREEREKDNITLMKERTAIESEMEVFSKLRQEVEEQLESLMSKKAEISYEKERIDNLRKETEEENQAIARLQYELEVERKALSMARAWAEDEAKRARENAKALEEARDRWEKRGLKIMVDDELRKEALEEDTWVNVEKQISVSGVAGRAENLLDKLKEMASQVSGKSRELINMIILKITTLISALKEWAANAGRQSLELKDATISKMGESAQELKQSAAGFTVTIQEGAKRVAGDCRDGVEKLTQKFKV